MELQQLSDLAKGLPFVHTKTGREIRSNLSEALFLPLNLPIISTFFQKIISHLQLHYEAESTVIYFNV